MTKLSGINVGDHVMVKMGRHIVGVEVVEKLTEALKVRSLTSGREFITNNVVDSPAVDDATEPTETDVMEDVDIEEETDEEEASNEPLAGEKKMSLTAAAAEVLRQENCPMNTKEMVRLAMEKGLWEPTNCKTPEQSLYGAIFLEIKKGKEPRFKKSDKKGCFELAD